MFRVINPNPQRIMTLLNGGVALLKGQLVVAPANGVVAAADAASANTIIGVAMEACAIAGTATISAVGGTDVEVDIYQGGTLKSFTAADLGKIYDINVASGVMTIDPNDTTGGFLVLTGYNNDAKVAYVRVLNAQLYIG